MAKTDKKTMELIATVKAQKAEIAKLEKPSYKTNCSFSYVEGHKGTATNLHVETDVKKLINMAAFIMDREKSYKEAAKALSVETVPDFTWDSYTAAEWIQDFRTRINKVQIATKREKLSKLEERLKNATKREKLSKLEERLKKIISPELQAELELEAIESELK